MSHSSTAREPDYQQQDEEAREQLVYQIADKCHSAKLDGYLTEDEFTHLLWELGLISTWKPKGASNACR